MKIAYILNHDISKNDGVTKKVFEQVTEWEKLGHKVEIFAITSKRGNNLLSLHVYDKNALFRIAFNKNLWRDINNYNPDIIYMRYDLLSRTILKLLGKYKFVVEINTDDINESLLLFKTYKSLKTFLRYIINYISRDIIFRNVYGIITVTEELSKMYIKYAKPTICVPNGINLEKYNIIKTVREDDKIGLFFIGSPNQPWQGVDIVEKIAKRLPDYYFHIVGPEGKNTKNLFYYGFLQREDYLRILNKSHICIGTLALYRKRMKEACPLKVREYLAYGYPVIIGYDDIAFLNQAIPDYILKIDPMNIELEIERIKNFILKNKNRVVTHEEIYSKISTKVLEEKRISFLERIAFK
uniref:Glycosyltransferase subfamily 4-like N-terminal domain-containing protein n=1 Tax=Dictyoglomus thermophilum TaxID=14 RepID=A0A7C3RJJ6_DICTH